MNALDPSGKARQGVPAPVPLEPTVHVPPAAVAVAGGPSPAGPEPPRPRVPDRVREAVRARHDNPANGGRARGLDRSRPERRLSSVELPAAPEQKYPRAPWEHYRTGRRRRHHLPESVMQRAFRDAVRASGVAQPAGCHSLRYSLATHVLDSGYDIRTIQERLRHSDVRTTMIYTHVLNRGGGRGVRSPSMAWSETNAQRGRVSSL